MIAASHTVQSVSNVSGNQEERLTRQTTSRGETADENSHKSLISHRVYNASNDCLQLPSPRNPPVDEICDSGIRKQAHSPSMLLMDHEIANHRRRE